MANKRLGDNTEIGAITGTDFIPVISGTDDYNIEVNDLASFYTIPTMKANISTNSINISSLGIDIDALEGLVSTNTINITALEADILNKDSKYTKNAINSGSVDANGNGNILSYSSNNVIFDTTPSITLTDYAGTTGTLSSIANLAIPTSPVSQTWRIYIGTNGTPVAYNASFTVGKVLTASPVANEVYYLTATETPIQYKRNTGNTAWEVFTPIYSGQAITNASGTITSVVQPVYNNNGYNANSKSVYGIIAPDYAKSISKSWNTTYTADTAGWVRVRSQVQTGGVLQALLTINSIIVWELTVAGNDLITSTGFVFVEKGSTYIASGGQTIQTISFIPCKGES